MNQRKSRKSPTSKQAQKFIAKARELGCDEDEAVFDEKLKSIASSKPRPEKDEPPGH